MNLLSKSLFSFPLLLLLSFCASKEAPPPTLTEITINNTGTYKMNSPLACYYGDNDPKECQVIDENNKGIPPGQSYNFFIRGNEKVRLVFPFDTIQRYGNKVYRPNCHILIDFYAYSEKRYHSNAQIKAESADPAKGFNCTVEVYEQALGDIQKVLMKDNLVSKIRYRTPRRGEQRSNYISNYAFQ